MKIAYVNLFVSGIGPAVAFYRDVLGLALEHADEAHGYASFEAGSHRLTRGRSEMHPTASSLHQVALHVTNLERSRTFYRDTLGAELIADFDPPGLLFFRLGGLRLLLERAEEAKPGGAVLYFSAPDIHSAHESLRSSGVAFDAEPHLIHRDDAGIFGDPGVEEWMAFFRDPDGHRLAIASRITPG